LKVTPLSENLRKLIKTIVNSFGFSVSCIAGIIEDYSQQYWKSENDDCGSLKSAISEARY